MTRPGASITRPPIAGGTEVLAIRYGTMLTTRQRTFYRYRDYGEPDGPAELAYYFWVVREAGQVTLIDTGFDVTRLTRRPGRTSTVEPLAALRKLGIEPADVGTVVLTHLHYDHLGNLRRFPAAEIVVQRRELEFWTGPLGRHPTCASITNPEEIHDLRSALAEGRVRVVDGEASISDAIRVERVGGHCPGQQIVHVAADRPVVLASDALHLYEEVDRDRPYETFTDLIEVFGAYARLRDLRDRDGAVLVAGHDPLVAERFARLPGAEHTVRIAGGIPATKSRPSAT